MRMCLAFSDHNKSWSMPCRVCRHNRLEKRQAGNCRQTKGAVCVPSLSTSINRRGNSLLHSVSCLIHYHNRNLSHTDTHMPSTSAFCFVFHSPELSSVCAMSLYRHLLRTLQVNHNTMGLESI